MTFLDKIKGRLLAGRWQDAEQKGKTAKSARQPRLKAANHSKAAHVSQGNNGIVPSACFDTRRIFYYFLFALLFLALYLTYLLMQPFWHTIILACIFAALVHPVYTRIKRKTGLRDYMASGLTLGVVVLLFCLPLTFFILQLIPQATSSIRDLSQWLGSNHLEIFINDKVIPFLHWVNDDVLTMVDIGVDDIRNSVMNLSRTAGQRLVGWGTGFVVDSVTIFINFLLMLLIMFFLLKDGSGMLKKLRQITPLREEQEENILQSLYRMAGAVLIGSFSIAAIQGLVGGIGLAIVGIPPLFWGSVMAAAALVPVIGTGLIWLPAVSYLALIGEYKSAVFLLAWCGILVTSIDSILRPIIMRGNSKVSLLFLFMSIFGGIKVFGMLGLIYGPLILSFVLAMVNIYSTEFEDMGDHKGVREPAIGRRLPGSHTLHSPRRYGAASRMLRAKAKKNTERFDIN